MKGKIHVVAYNKRVHYDIVLNRKITIIQGDSATGKTTLIGIIRENSKSNTVTGTQVNCSKPCITLSVNKDEALSYLKSLDNTVIFLDESSEYIRSKEFAEVVVESGCYFVIITRDGLENLPYSINEIYEFHSSGYYQTTKRVYNELRRVYTTKNVVQTPDQIYTEDSGAGFEMYQAACTGVEVYSSEGKSSIKEKMNSCNLQTLFIVDGAAFGSNIGSVLPILKQKSNVMLWAPESFEYLLLSSGIIKDKHLDDKLKNTSDYVEAKTFSTWEQYFTELLIELTRYSEHPYNKNKLYVYYKSKRNLDLFRKLLPFTALDNMDVFN